MDTGLWTRIPPHSLPAPTPESLQKENREEGGPGMGRLTAGTRRLRAGIKDVQAGFPQGSSRGAPGNR